MRRYLLTATLLLFLSGAGVAATEAELEEEFAADIGDQVVFGQDEAFELERISQNALWIIPEGDVETGQTERLGIVNESRMIIEWPSGEYDVFVNKVLEDTQEAQMEIWPVYSESSGFNCQDYSPEENQYVFCTNQGEEAEQEIDLGHTQQPLNFVRNAEKRSGGGLYSLFVSDGQTVQFNHGEPSEWKEAEIEIIEWRGLTDEHGGENQLVVIEVDRAEAPDASIDFDRNEYETGETASLEFEAFQPGEYRLEVTGAGLSELASFDEEDRVDEVSLEPSEEGLISAELVAPGKWWNPLDSDEVVSTDSAEVSRSIEDRDHAFGEIIEMQEGDTTIIEGRSFHLRALMPEGALWRPGEDGDTNSPLSLLRRPENMDFRYDEDFEAYGYICEMDEESGSASIVVEEERLNPWNVCDRHPSELREQNDYRMHSYEPGEKITLREGQSLSFGDSRAFLEEIEPWEDMYLMDGYNEWVGESSQWNPPQVNYSTTDWFYEGEMATATCDISEDEITLVMRSVDEEVPDDMDWPHDWCHIPEHVDEVIEVDEQTETPSWGDRITVSEGTEVAPVYWGQGFLVEDIEEAITSQEKSITLTDYRADEEVSITETESETLQQDYVIHNCQATSEEAEIILTTGAENTEAICSEERGVDHISLNLEASSDTIMAEASMEVPTPCHAVEGSGSATENEVEFVFEVVDQDEDRFCPQRISSDSASVSIEVGPGEYDVKAEASDAWDGSETVTDTFYFEEDVPDLDIRASPVNPDVLEEVEFTAVTGEEHDLSYEWDIYGDEDVDAEGLTAEAEYETAGEKEVTVEALRDGEVVTEESTVVDVSAPEVSSSIQLSDESITRIESVDISYSAGEAVARNGYRLEVINSEEEKVLEEDKQVTSGRESFNPGRNAATGTYTVRLVEEQGFLSSVLGSIFGHEAEASFEVIAASEDLSTWLEFCEERDYSHDSPSDRVSCIQDEIVPECFDEDADSECLEIADSVCEYYVGTGFDPDEGGCIQ